jgi:hypothetical protein
MNEFQAILTEVIFFSLRFAVPAALVFVLARVLHHMMGEDVEDKTTPDAS